MNAPSRPGSAVPPLADVDPARTPPLADPDRRTGPDDLTAPADTDPPAAPPGYELLGEVGEGGMGVVYRARDAALDRDVAVKFLRDRFRTDGPAAKRFLDEARITGQLQHPGIPPVHQVGTLPDGRPFLVMKLIKGRTLAELLADRAADRGRLVAEFEQVCQAVGYAHAHKVVHRDLKPANVMVGAFAEVQVMDWGLAKVLTDRADSTNRAGDPDSTLGTEIQSLRDAEDATRAGSVLGTPAYMPPEQAIGAIDQIDQRSDVFGLGAILCAILTGKPPYVGADHESTRQLAARARLDDAFGRLAACGAEPEFVALCKRCLAVEKAGRPADGGEVAKAVAGLRAAAEERARRAELERAAAAAEAREQRKRRRVLLALAGAVLLLLGSGGAFAWWQDKEATRQREQLSRNGDAVAELLTRCEDSLREGATEKAAAALEQAENRAAEGGVGHLTDRFARCRTDLGLLRQLDAIDALRWSPVEGKFSDAKAVVARWRAALAGYGLVPGEGPADEAADRVVGSLVRDHLLTTLDLWLVFDPDPGVRAVLRAADPDPYRDAVRDAVAAGDQKQVAELAGRPEALVQPPGFAAALGRHSAVAPDERRRQVLEAALRSRTGDLGLLMALGGSYPINQREGADERLRWFQAAVAAHPRNAAAHNSLGIALSEKGDRDRGIAAYREAIRLDPKWAVPHNNLGAALAGKRDLDGAVAAYREAIRLNPDGAAISYRNLGNALRDLKDLDGAIAAYREALRCEPKYVSAHTSLRAALRDKFGPDAAVEEYRQAVRDNPKDASAHISLGDSLRVRKDLDGAVAAYRNATELDPKLITAHANLGHALKEKGDWDAALAAYWGAIRLNPNQELLYFQIRQCHVAKGDRDGAVKAAQEAVRLFPTVSLAHHCLGDALHFEKGDSVAAAAAYRQAIRLNPIHTYAHHNLGVALRSLGDLDGAIVSFREALRLDPKNSHAFNNLTAALNAKGDALRDRKDYDGAIAAYWDAIRLNPKDGHAPYYMVRCYVAKGDFDGAVRDAGKALDLDPTSARSLHNLGDALLDSKDYRTAAGAYRKAITLDPNYSWSHNNLGWALRRSGDLGGAVAAFRRAAQLDPKFHAGLGAALKDSGDLDGAIVSVKAAIRFDPKDFEAHRLLARMLATGPDEVRDGNRAVEHATRACELCDWKFAGCFDTLAAAYAEIGNFDKAVECQKRALAVSFPEWAKGEGKDARQRLDLYGKRKPYRDPALSPPPREHGPRPREVRHPLKVGK